MMTKLLDTDELQICQNVHQQGTRTGKTLVGLTRGLS